MQRKTSILALDIRRTDGSCVEGRGRATLNQQDAVRREPYPPVHSLCIREGDAPAEPECDFDCGLGLMHQQDAVRREPYPPGHGLGIREGDAPAEPYPPSNTTFAKVGA